MIAQDRGAAPRAEQARTRLARRAVIDAARTLFLERGYAATTMAAISRAAEVPEPTLYRLFASKVGVLKAVLDTSIAGDDAPEPVAARPAVADLAAEPDAAQVVAGLVAVATAINRRTNEVYEVLTRAADADAEAAELLAAIQAQRDAGQRGVVRMLHRRGMLRKGLGEREAADVVHALMAPEVYRLLVRDRGWPPERYEAWAARTLTHQLL